MGGRFAHLAKRNMSFLWMQISPQFYIRSHPLNQPLLQLEGEQDETQTAEASVLVLLESNVESLDSARGIRFFAGN